MNRTLRACLVGIGGRINDTESFIPKPLLPYTLREMIL